MPIYEYACQVCGGIFELIEVGPQATAACPRCGGPSSKIPSKGVSHRKAEGVREGRTCCGSPERCGEPPCHEGGACLR